MGYEGRRQAGIERERARARERHYRVYGDPVLRERERQRKREHWEQRIMRDMTVSSALAAAAEPWIQAVVKVSKLDLVELKGRSRASLVSSWRHVLWFLLREHTPMSYEEIGTIFERDHTTILYGVRKVRNSPELIYDGMLEKARQEVDGPAEG